MPAFKATVVGENFQFVVDDEAQLLDFTRTLYVDAEDEATAHQAALARVREELIAQALLDDDGGQLLTIDELCQAESQADEALIGEFIWYFPEDDDPGEDD
ncbi:MAG: hypothetical protein P8019_03850 [Gammaproteobacteria bacterium]